MIKLIVLTLALCLNTVFGQQEPPAPLPNDPTGFIADAVPAPAISDDSMMFNPFLDTNDYMVKTPQDLDIDEPYLWQMAAFSARQMSDKRLKFKLLQLTSAEKIDSNYRLRVTLKRLKLDEPMSKNDVLYCTVEVIDNEGRWEMDNFGCSMPAPVRIRDRSNSILKDRPTQLDKQPLDNMISDEPKTSSSLYSHRSMNQPTMKLSFLGRRSIMQQPVWPPHQYMPPLRYLPPFAFPEFRPQYRFYY